MTRPDRCSESKTFTEAPANTHGYVDMEANNPVVRMGKYTPLEGPHRRCTGAMANRTIEGIPVVEEAVARFCDNIHAQCPILRGGGMLL